MTGMVKTNINLVSRRPSLCLLGLIALVALFGHGCVTSPKFPIPMVSKWAAFELRFESTSAYDNPFQDVAITAQFLSPSGRELRVPGFWDGDNVWRVRFAPDELGEWQYTTTCTDPDNRGLHQRAGRFLCTPQVGATPLAQQGPIRVARNGRYLAHESGQPFFWLADTAWNGALLSTPEEWQYYIQNRRHQGFTAVQFVTTQWRAAPHGDRFGQLPYSGRERITVHPDFFQRMDQKVTALEQNGLLAAPVLLWAIQGGSNPEINPGVSLPEDQAILLARYMVARWGAHKVLWILAGDGNYQGDRAEKWKRIGRAVFSDIDHAPVLLHPGGMQWPYDQFKDEDWLSVLAYQSGHGDDNRTLQWIFSGPPATQWQQFRKPLINIEPPYEFHISYQSKTRISPLTVRRASYWSLLSTPTAGVSYGGHGVWGWDDGTRPPIDHPNSGTPLPWPLALDMPGAEQMRHLSHLFRAIPFWTLRPAQEILANQPGKADPKAHIAAAQSATADLTVVYTPQARAVDLHIEKLPAQFSASWFDPRTGATEEVVAAVNGSTIQFATPSEGDWVLLLKSKKTN